MPVFCRYEKHTAFHATQISRLCVESLENLAACVLKRQLPEDFPPKDICATLFKNSYGVRPSSAPIAVTVPSAVVAQSAVTGQEKTFVTVSESKKRPHPELKSQADSGDANLLVCEFTPTEKVCGAPQMACRRSCQQHIAVVLVGVDTFFVAQFNVLRCSVCKGEFKS